MGAYASSSYYPASNAFDGSEVRFWVANGGGEQWIELDLGSSHTVRKIRLLTEQSGSDFTEHNVYVGNTTPPTNLVATFTGTTVTNQWLDKTFTSNPPTGQYVRIVTPTSNSWRAWRDIAVYE